MSHPHRTRPLVLVVDDDATLRDSLRAILESAGYLVSVAGSAGEALSEVRSQRPDVILADIYMPLGDGYELISALRCVGDNIPVIAMSGGPAVSSLPISSVWRDEWGRMKRSRNRSVTSNSSRSLTAFVPSGTVHLDRPGFDCQRTRQVSLTVGWLSHLCDVCIAGVAIRQRRSPGSCW